MKDIEKVPLYRCKLCKVPTRMFLSHCAQHLLREHELEVVNGSVRKYFARGKKDTPAHPGGHHRAIYQPMSRGRRKPATAIAS